MKKIIALILTTAMIFGTTPVFAEGAFPGKQTATATLDQEGHSVRVIVDLSGGWSAYFARGAVYLYDGPNDINTDAVAIGITQDKETYNDYLKYAENQKGYRTEDGIVSFVDENGDAIYLQSDDHGAYFFVSVTGRNDPDEVFSRFALDFEDTNQISGPIDSDLYTEDDINAAIETTLIEFLTWKGCELNSLHYAGDESVTEENLKWINEISGSNVEKYDEVIELLMDFHTSTEEEDLEGTAWEPDKEYTQYQWWLGRADGGEWEIVTNGYE